MAGIAAEKERTKLSEEIALLESLDTNQLRARWKNLYGIAAPLRFSRDLLRRAIAYRMQEDQLGGLKPTTRRLLERVAQNARARRPIRVAPATKLMPGTVLLREWSGTQHRVTVLEGGVMFRGIRHRSLSEVARLITGSHWSGPAFFGIKANRQRVYRETH